MPSRLRIMVLPDRSREVLEDRYRSVVEYLSGKLRIPCELVIPASYDQFVEEFAAGRAELGFFGGYTYVVTGQRMELAPLVVRDLDRHFTTVFLTTPKNRGRSLNDFRGQRLAFGPRLSTSGHLMARDFLERRGIVAEEFFQEVRYSKGHDDTAHLVRDGEVDLGAANAVTVKRMLARGELDPAAIVVLLETTPYPDYLWAMPASLPAGLRSAVRSAFLSLSQLDEGDARVLADQDAQVFLPVLSDDLRKIEELVRKLQAREAGIKQGAAP